MFITGPEVVKAVTGEDVTFEDLGGPQVHNEKSGVAHFAAEDDRAALRLVRRLLSYMPSNNVEDPPTLATDDPPDRRGPPLPAPPPGRGTTLRPGGPPSSRPSCPGSPTGRTTCGT